MGEIFSVPFLTFDGLAHNVLSEATPGHGFQQVLDRRYDEDPNGFEHAVPAGARTGVPTLRVVWLTLLRAGLPPKRRGDRTLANASPAIPGMSSRRPPCV
jgi:hypothetical protein